MAKGGAMILDTCALLWLASGSKRISTSTLRRINETPALYVCAISGFEIAAKVSEGKLKLPYAASDWFERVLEHHGISILPLDLANCVRAAELPRFHDDPCDRFIIAAAIALDVPVVTSDENFDKYGIAVII